MKNLTLRLIPEYLRPVISLYNTQTLIDTGAIIPVISLPMEKLQVRFQAEIVKENIAIGGFGGGVSQGNIYSLKNFYIRDWHFKKFECFVPRAQERKFPIMLSASVFLDIDYEFKPQNHQLILKIPDNKMTDNEFIIKLVKDKVYIQVNGITI